MDEVRPFTTDPTRARESFSLRGAEVGAERARLVRYCLRITGNRDAAEDIAQETLVTAWRNRSSLRDPAAQGAWLTGIARNLCLRYLRQVNHERRRLAPYGGGETPLPFVLDRIADDRLPDPEEYLERAEIAMLLDKALGSLPRATHDLLIARYVEDLPLAEIASRRGQREETTAVHLHRGRLALRRALVGPKLRDESLALGLVRDAEAQNTQDTRIWCPKCGKRHLRGHLARGLFPVTHQGKSQPGAPREEATEFQLRCPACDDSGGALVLMRLFRSSPDCDLLDGIKGLKPALNRVSVWWDGYARAAATRRVVACVRCGTPAAVSTYLPDCDETHVRPAEPALYTGCPRCGAGCTVGVMDIALHHPAGRDFWRDNPRLTVPPAYTVASADGGLVVTRLESVTGGAVLDVVCRADTLEVVRANRG